MNKWEQIVNSNRKGIIFIDNQIFKNDVELVQKILSKVLVCEARPRFSLDSMAYYCYHETFDPVNEGSVVPVYDVIISKHNDEFTWVFSKSTQDVIFL